VKLQVVDQVVVLEQVSWGRLKLWEVGVKFDTVKEVGLAMEHEVVHMVMEQESLHQGHVGRERGHRECRWWRGGS